MILKGGDDSELARGQQVRQVVVVVVVDVTQRPLALEVALSPTTAPTQIALPILVVTRQQVLRDLNVVGVAPAELVEGAAAETEAFLTYLARQLCALNARVAEATVAVIDAVDLRFATGENLWPSRTMPAGLKLATIRRRTVMAAAA